MKLSLFTALVLAAALPLTAFGGEDPKPVRLIKSSALALLPSEDCCDAPAAAVCVVPQSEVVAIPALRTVSSLVLPPAPCLQKQGAPVPRAPRAPRADSSPFYSVTTSTTCNDGRTKRTPAVSVTRAPRSLYISNSDAPYAVLVGEGAGDPVRIEIITSSCSGSETSCCNCESNSRRDRDRVSRSDDRNRRIVEYVGNRPRGKDSRYSIRVRDDGDTDREHHWEELESSFEIWGEQFEEGFEDLEAVFAELGDESWAEWDDCWEDWDDNWEEWEDSWDVWESEFEDSMEEWEDEFEDSMEDWEDEFEEMMERELGQGRGFLHEREGDRQRIAESLEEFLEQAFENAEEFRWDGFEGQFTDLRDRLIEWKDAIEKRAGEAWQSGMPLQIALPTGLFPQLAGLEWQDDDRSELLEQRLQEMISEFTQRLSQLSEGNGDYSEAQTLMAEKLSRMARELAEQSAQTHHGAMEEFHRHAQRAAEQAGEARERAFERFQEAQVRFQEKDQRKQEKIVREREALQRKAERKIRHEMEKLRKTEEREHRRHVREPEDSRHSAPDYMPRTIRERIFGDAPDARDGPVRISFGQDAPAPAEDRGDVLNQIQRLVEGMQSEIDSLRGDLRELRDRVDALSKRNLR